MANATGWNHRTLGRFIVYFPKNENTGCTGHLPHTHWYFYPQHDFLQPNGTNYLGCTFHYLAMGGIRKLGQV